MCDTLYHVYYRGFLICDVRVVVGEHEVSDGLLLPYLRVEVIVGVKLDSACFCVQCFVVFRRCCNYGLFEKCA